MTRLATPPPSPSCRTSKLHTAEAVWAIIFFGRRPQIYKKSASIKLQQKFYEPPYRYTLPPKQAEIHCIEITVILNKLNNICGHHLACDSTCWQWRSHRGARGGQSATPESEKFAKNREKERKN